ncbi:response regulator transcription factor [Pseudonocardia abyssalis]|uniref:Response regulator transcription factor n=1 Tax=Pseudonocardia abyssalis TaxID=2792008 RepID=A0ABS6UU79_9PSEU|nr:response regulator transcription factor [Pseudonocardia abyssalis]MBW0114727.1 response regulator transcription factor [Pseudonocardia abyssalis]MBW0135811.1 response regulator transcription factor [Pseudonocardia abyssalis]
MTAGSPVSAVLLHGHPRADALRSGGITVLGVVDSVEQALALAPDVLVVDLAGPDALAAIAAASDDGAAVLAVSVSGEHTEVLAAVRAGATGYVVDTGRPWDVADAVTRLAAGQPAYGPGLAATVLEASGGPASPDVRLTERESDVLRLVVEGLTARQVATRLGLSPRTVENHVQHLLRKLPVSNRAGLVRYAIEHGLA